MYNFRIREFVFGGISTTAVYFKVENFKAGVIVTFPARDLYLNLNLLKEFSPEDVRLITCFAIQEEIALDQVFLRKKKRKIRV
jgi:hypothetical protein